MKKIEIIKKGDRVKVTTDGNILNKFTSRYNSNKIKNVVLE